MSIRHIVTGIIIFLLALQSIQAQEQSKKVRFNAGLKVGFHAATYNSTNFKIDGYEYDDRVIQSNKIGYSVSPFVRISKNRLYVQTEGTLSLSRHNFEFKEILPDNAPALEDATKPQYKLTTYCIQVPLLVGYEFVNSGPYGMSVFTGPKAKFIFTAHDKQEFKHFKHTHLEEQLQPIVYYWEVGLGVKISNFCFDFIYDFGLNKNSNGIISKKSGEKFYSRRSDNLLSFSVGIFF